MEPSSSENVLASISSIVTAYVGNLRSDLLVEGLEEKILSLFGSIGVFLLPKEDIVVHRKSPKKPAYCFVNLKDRTTFDFAVKKLNGIECLENNDLVFPGKKLEVSAARRNRPNFEKIEPVTTKKTKNHRSRKSKRNNSHEKSNGGMIHSVAVGTNPVTKETNLVAMETTSVTMGANSVPMKSILVPKSNGKKYDIVTDDENVCYSVAINGNHGSTDHGGNHYPVPSQRYFYVGQKLGTEDRLTEYKQGGGNYLDLIFKTHVGKYICAFLNSEGGMLLIGVKDDCHVCGVSISSHREDQLRLDVDKIMKGFNPPVFTNSYSVKFIPVHASPVTLNENSTSATKLHDPKFDINLASVESHLESISQKINFGEREINVKIKSDLKVIEFAVHPPKHQRGEPHLYENEKGEVYIRRDGSIQGPLKASQILAWSKQNTNESYNLEKHHLQQELQSKQGEIEMNLKLVDEMVKQKQFLEDQYQEKIDKLKGNADKLNEEIDLLRSQEKQMQGELEQIKRTKSKVCNIL